MIDSSEQYRIASEINSTPEILRELREMDARIDRLQVQLERTFTASSALTARFQAEIN